MQFGLPVCAALLGGALWAARPAPSPRPPAQPAPAAPWIKIVSPIPLFDLPDTIFGHVGSYEAWRRRGSAGRRDVMTFGRFDAGASFMRLTLTQPWPGFERQPFFADIAREAALSGLIVARSAVPDGANSRFGQLTVADVALNQAGSGRDCLAFRTDGDPLALTGVACGAQSHPFGRAELVCALDRLDLLGGGAESPLTTFFARSELARGRLCRADALAPVKARATWLDPGQDLPRFKTDRASSRTRLRTKSAKL